jgi:eukaryotic-like serine/threonine-protein kinase
MTRENWNKVKALFEAALAQQPDQRAAFLSQNCPEDDLRLEVEKLLANSREAGSFLSKPAVCAELLAETTSLGGDDPMVGRRLGAYKLTRRVGQGGMAAVYQAVRADGEFHQQVAIKLVQPGLDSEEVLKRFRNERQTLAGLDHPNVVKLLDGGSTPDGAPYLVMDYVEGSPIDEYCDRQKLGVEERLGLFGKVCEAVEHAHQKRVIHRDLKPSNILVTAEGVPKLLDFGIAKVLEPTAERLLLTQTGTRCMTPAYASPEQVRGRPVTPATDIYSLGVVLYELLSGHRPYRLKDETASEMERAICEQEPEPPSTAVSRAEPHHPPAPSSERRGANAGGSADLPSKSAAFPLDSAVELRTRENLRRRLRGDLDNILLKALRKEPERRYQSAQEFERDIERHLNCLPVTARPASLGYRTSKFMQRHKTEVSMSVMGAIVLAAAALLALNTFRAREQPPGSAVTPRIKSLAVLPLVNLSGDPAQEYFSDGMTDALITELAQIGSVKVISRTSSMQYRKTDKTLPQIARELNVDGIVEGTVQRSGDRVRITAQLVQASSDKHLWAASYERDVQDVFTLDRDVAGDIAHQVQARLTTQDQTLAARARPVNPKALEAYLQANYHLFRFGRGAGDEEKREAAKYFQQAIEADPNFAPAYNGLSISHQQLMWPSKEDGDIAARAAERALDLDPNLSEARENLGEIKRLRDWDFRGAEEEYRRAVALSPNSAEAHSALCFLLLAINRADEGLRECQIAQGLNPRGDYLPDAFYAKGQYDQAIELAGMSLRSDPDNIYSHYGLYHYYAMKGMYNEASLEAEKCFFLLGDREAAARIHRALVRSGPRAAIRQVAAESEHTIGTKKAYLPGVTAEAYAILGDNDRAFYWLEEAYRHHDTEWASTDSGLEGLRWNRVLDGLRADPRYRDLARRIGLPPEINESSPGLPKAEGTPSR